MDVEENWDSVHEFELPIAKSEDESVFPYEAFAKLGFEKDSKIVNFLEKLHAFFIDYGFSYLEVNPFTFDKNDTIVCLDMVARVDSCEAFKQKNTWKDLEFPGGFGDKKTESEKYIEKLDSETGASLKLTILSPNGKIWLLTSGGGASVAIADTLGDMGLAQDIANYGECSGNPDRENTRAYTETLLKNLIANGHKNQYLLIAGAIANFTHIDKTFSGIIDALEKYQKELRENKTTILVRRGGINDKK